MKRLASVGLTYGLSTVLLLVGEVLLARSSSDTAFGQYSLIKQSVPMIAALGLLGFDQALTRESALRGLPARLGSTEFRLGIRTVALSLVLAIYMSYSVGVSWQTAAVLPVAALGVAATNLVSGIMRAVGSSGWASTVLQGHRLLAGCILILFLGELSSTQAVWTLGFSAIAIALVALVHSSRINTVWRPSPHEIRLMKRLGLGYTLSLFALAASDWIDQALISQFADTATNGLYAQAKLIAVYPLSSLGGILAFLALPAVARRATTFTASLFVRWLVWGTVATFATASALLPVSRVALEHLLGADIPKDVVLVLLVCGGLRILYTMPSAVVGALATPRQLLYSGLGGLVGLLAQAVTTVTVGTSLDWMLGAAYGLLSSILLRFFVSVLVGFAAIRNTQTKGALSEHPT